MKTVLSIQDLSCVGRCSLTVALPVLSALGHRCSVLPTAVLSTHTGFQSPVVIPMTSHLQSFGAHWARENVKFDAVTTGYLSDPQQAEAVLSLVKDHRAKGSLIITDPAMGDHGKLYRGMGPGHIAAMQKLCSQADILLPNLTEAALLTQTPYPPNPSQAELRLLSASLLSRFPAQAVVITGVSGTAGTIGFYGCHRETGEFTYQVPVVPRQFHGTGDLFAAVFTGCLLQGWEIPSAAAKAADFVRLCVAGTPSVTPHGVAFEPQLPELYHYWKEERFCNE